MNISRIAGFAVGAIAGALLYICWWVGHFIVMAPDRPFEHFQLLAGTIVVMAIAGAVAASGPARGE